jgi:hypothetical protein
VVCCRSISAKSQALARSWLALRASITIRFSEGNAYWGRDRRVGARWLWFWRDDHKDGDRSTTTTAASPPTTTATPATTTTTAASVNQAILASKYNAAYNELMRTIRQSARSADPSDQTAVAGVYEAEEKAREQFEQTVSTLNFPLSAQPDAKALLVENRSVEDADASLVTDLRMNNFAAANHDLKALEAEEEAFVRAGTAVSFDLKQH